MVAQVWCREKPLKKQSWIISEAHRSALVSYQKAPHNARFSYHLWKLRAIRDFQYCTGDHSHCVRYMGKALSYYCFWACRKSRKEWRKPLVNCIMEYRTMSLWRWKVFTSLSWRIRYPCSCYSSFGEPVFCAQTASCCYHSFSRRVPFNKLFKIFFLGKDKHDCVIL